jgi:cytochrome P450 family 4 subfamily V
MRRRLITPAFHFEILGDFLHVMNEQAEILIEKLSESAKNEKETNIFTYLGNCTLDIICGR